METITKGRSGNRQAEALREAPALERIITDEPVFLENMEVGNVSHQGDLTVIAIPRLPKTLQHRSNRQLADGTTKGSNHVMTRGDIYDGSREEIAALIKEANGEVVDEEFLGPVFVSPPNPTKDDLTHPEHGNQGFPAGMILAVKYQRTVDSQNQIRRSLD